MSGAYFLDQQRKRKIAQARDEITRRKHWLKVDLKKYGFNEGKIRAVMAAIEDTRRTEMQARRYLETEVLPKLEQDVPNRLRWELIRHAKAINASHHTIQKLQGKFY